MTPSFLKGAKRADNYDSSTPTKAVPSFLKGAKRNEIESEREPDSSFLGQFKDFLNSPEESAFEKGLGTATRAVSSAVLGAPGNIRELQKQAGNGTVDFVTNQLGLPPSPQENVSRILPTTSDVEKGFDEMTDNQYQPTEETQPFYEAQQDLTSMFLPGTGPMKAWQRIAAPIVGQLGKQGVKAIGGSEKSQELAKTGLMLGLSLASSADGEKYAGSLMEQAKQLIPPGTMINAKPIENALTRVKGSTWFRGADLPSTQPAKKLLASIEQNIQNGMIEGQMALELRKNANEFRKNLGAFNIFEKNDKKKAIALLDEVKSSVIKGLDHYGKTIDPVFGKLNEEANRAFATFGRSQVIKNYIEKNAPSLKSETANKLFKAGMVAGELALGTLSPLAASGAAAAATAGYGITKSVQLLYRIMNDPKLREYYTLTLQNAAKQNSHAMIRNMKKLDEELYNKEGQ